MTRMTPLLERNEQLARTYTPIALGPAAAKVVIVSCLDHRTDPAITLGLKLGDAPVIRNAGGRVTQPVIEDIAYLAYLAEQVFASHGPPDKLFEVAVIHHTPSAAPGSSPAPPSGTAPPRQPACPGKSSKPPPSPTRTPPSRPTSNACSPHPSSPPR